MLLSLKSLWRERRRRPDGGQLTLDFGGEPSPRSADEFLARLRALGLERITHCRLTKNRNVMVSFRGDELRVHEGFLAAPRPVHEAIVTFVEGRSRASRLAARRQIVSFQIETPQRALRRERTHPDDEALAVKLTTWHERYNLEHFEGALKAVPVRVSRRMKSRLGHYSSGTKDTSAEIAISRRHLRRHGWEEALHTLLHEMVHQWQDETGRVIDHGRAFRAKAREVGIVPSARRRPGARVEG